MGSPSRPNSDSRKSAIFFRARRISITVFAHHTLARLHGALQGLRIRNSDLADGDSIKFHTCGSSALPILLRYSRWLTSTPRETGRCCVIKSSPNLSSLRPLSTLHASSPLPRFSLSSHFRRVRSTCRNGVHGAKWRHRVYGHDTIAILWAYHDTMRSVKWRRFIVLFEQNWTSSFKKMSTWSLTYLSAITATSISQTVYLQDGGRNWHSCGTTLRHCRLYRCAKNAAYISITDSFISPQNVAKTTR